MSLRQSRVGAIFSASPRYQEKVDIEIIVRHLGLPPPLLYLRTTVEREQSCWVNLPSSQPNTGGGQGITEACHWRDSPAVSLATLQVPMQRGRGKNDACPLSLRFRICNRLGTNNKLATTTVPTWNEPVQDSDQHHRQLPEGEREK